MGLLLLEIDVTDFVMLSLTANEFINFLLTPPPQSLFCFGCGSHANYLEILQIFILRQA